MYKFSQIGRTASERPEGADDTERHTGTGAAERLPAAPDPDATRDWLASSALIDLWDPKLQARARALGDGCGTEREKALAIFTFVRRLPLCAGLKLRFRTAREVLKRRRGDAIDKATLLLALLRIAGLPARVKFATPYAAALRGLPTDVSSMLRPLVEVRVEGRWVGTDTYIFDSQYLAAARQRLRRERQEYGYGIHATGGPAWEARRDAYVLDIELGDQSFAAGGRPWLDPLEFARSLRSGRRLAFVAMAACWNVAAPFLERSIRAIRAEQPRRPAPEQPARGRASRSAPAGRSRNGPVSVSAAG